MIFPLIFFTFLILFAILSYLSQKDKKEMIKNRPPFQFFNQTDGKETNGSFAVVPIFTMSNEYGYEFIGTGFFITGNGAIATAKHNIKDSIGNVYGPLFIAQFDTDVTYLIRQITKVYTLDNYDIALCLPQEVQHSKSGDILRNKILPISGKYPNIGESIITFAYPKTQFNNIGEHVKLYFNTSFSQGEIVQYHSEGFGILKNPCFQTSMEILSGASGGPVINSKGEIIGINSTGYDFMAGEEPLSFITPIMPLLDLQVDVPDSPEGKMTLRELASRGIINIQH